MIQRCIAGGIWSKTISPKSRSSAPSPRDTTRQSKASAPTSTLPLRSSPQGKCQQTLKPPALLGDIYYAGERFALACLLSAAICYAAWLTSIVFCAVHGSQPLLIADAI